MYLLLDHIPVCGCTVCIGWICEKKVGICV
jgi:hypothetical protein